MCEALPPTLKKKTKGKDWSSRTQNLFFISPRTEVTIRGTGVCTPALCYCFRVPSGVMFSSFLRILGVLGRPWDASGPPWRPKSDFSWFLMDFRVPLGVAFGVDFRRFAKKIEQGHDFGAILGRIFAGSTFLWNFHDFRGRLDRKKQAKPLYCHQKTRFRRSLANPVRESIFHWFWRHFGTLWASTWSPGAIFARNHCIPNSIGNLSRFSEIFSNFGGFRQTREKGPAVPDGLARGEIS